jgi:Zn-dependent peptidase ImmA (M78 family)
MGRTGHRDLEGLDSGQAGSFTVPAGGELDLANYRRAQEAAERLLEKYGIHSAPIDPEIIAEGEGIDVVYAGFADRANEKISGFIDPNECRIYVNRDIPPNRKTFTIAHELGHHALHREYTQSGKYRILPRLDEYEEEKPDEEKEADAFAANLLVPLKLLRRYKDHASVSELARMFLVSEAVILNRLNWV